MPATSATRAAMRTALPAAAMIPPRAGSGSASRHVMPCPMKSATPPMTMPRIATIHSPDIQGLSRDVALSSMAIAPGCRHSGLARRHQCAWTATGRSVIGVDVAALDGGMFPGAGIAPCRRRRGIGSRLLGGRGCRRLLRPTPRTPSAANLVSGPHVVVDPNAGQLDVVVELPVVEASRGRCALLERHPPAQGAVGSLSLGVAAPRAGPQRV